MSCCCLSFHRLPLTSNSKSDSTFHHTIRDYSRADWDGLRFYLRDVLLEDIFELGPAAEFCEWVQVRIDVYIPHCKYHVKPHSSPWFSAAYAAAVVHGNHILYFCLHNKYTLSKIKLRQAIDHCKRFLGAAKLAYANKTKYYITPQNFGSF